MRWVTIAALVTLGLVCVSRIELTNSIVHFMPSRSEAELVDLSLQLVTSPLARRMLLAIEGGPEAAEAADELADALGSHPEVAWIESGFDDDSLRAIYELYFDRRLFFVSDSPETDIPAMLEPDALAARARRLRAQLAGPEAMLRARTAAADPLGLFDTILARLEATRPSTHGDATDPGSSSESFAVVQLGLRSSPFQSAQQELLLRDIEAAFARVDEQYGGGLQLHESGVNRFAVASERTIRRDVNFISAVSLSVVTAIFLLVFHSMRQLVIAILTPVSGFVVALSIALASSDPVHGITLGFGFVLIGVAIDYPIHLISHHALSAPGTPPRETVSRIRSSLLVSGLTTTLAFLALSLSSFPRLADMGTFAAVGVPVALLLTLWSTPAFLGATQLRWEDDPSTLMTMDPQLLAESRRIEQRVANYDTGRFVVGIAADPDACLRLNDVIHGRLQEAVVEGHLEGIGSVHSLIWSRELQRQNLAVLQAVPELGERIDRAFSSAGFRRGAFDAFAAAVSSPVADPLRPSDLSTSPLARVLDALVELDGRWAIVTYLRGVHSGVDISAAIDDIDGAYYVDQKEIMAEVYKGYRRSTVRMVAIGCVLVFIILQLRYRSVTRGALAFLPSALGALGTLGIFGLMGIPLNVVGAVSLLVVVGLGVDYGVFSVDGATRMEQQGATMCSILVSCLTSVFVFGVLALSSQPVLRAIGLTTGTGMLIALSLAPPVLALSRLAHERGRLTT
jgi:predicted exporter